MSQAEITAKIQAFANELHAMVMKEAVAAVAAALGTGGNVRAATTALRTPAPPSAAPKRRRRRGRPAAKAAPAASGGAAKPAATGSASDAAIVDYVKAHAGSRAEEIVKALRAPTEQVKARLSDLVAKKAIKKTGKTRGTKYFPA